MTQRYPSITGDFPPVEDQQLPLLRPPHFYRTQMQGVRPQEDVGGLALSVEADAKTVVHIDRLDFGDALDVGKRREAELVGGGKRLPSGCVVVGAL